MNVICNPLELLVSWELRSCTYMNVLSVCLSLDDATVFHPVCLTSCSHRGLAVLQQFTHWTVWAVLKQPVGNSLQLCLIYSKMYAVLSFLYAAPHDYVLVDGTEPVYYQVGFVWMCHTLIYTSSSFYIFHLSERDSHQTLLKIREPQIKGPCAPLCSSLTDSSGMFWQIWYKHQLGRPRSLKIWKENFRTTKWYVVKSVQHKMLKIWLHLYMKRIMDESVYESHRLDWSWGS